MATIMNHEGNFIIEPNNVTFTRDGRVEAQVPAKVDVQNGMLLAIDYAKNEVRLPTADDTVIGLNYTSEKIYNQFTPGLKNFKVEAGKCPRIGFLTTGDVFTTNAVCYNSEDALVAGAVAYVSTTGETAGLIHVGAESGVGPALIVTKVTTLPDGQKGVEFHVQ